MLLSLILNMNVKLIIWNGDSVVVKALLNRLKNIEMYRPIIRALHPNASGNNDTTLSVLGKSYEGCGIAKNKIVGCANVHNKRLCPLKIVVIRNGEGKANSSRILLGVVNNIGI